LWVPYWLDIIRDSGILSWIERHDGLIGGLIGAVGVIVAVLLFWKEQTNRRKRDEDELKQTKIRCYTTIEKELEDHFEALNSSDYDIIQDNENFPFRSLFLNIDAYTSLLSSGLFTHFPKLTQLALANLYIRIKVHNEYQVQRSMLKGNFQIHGSSNKRMDWSLIALEGDRILSTYQKEILDILEDLINLIEIEKSNLTSM
jgi:hypothetical protein